MIESPVFEKGYPSYEAVNKKPSMKLRYSEAFYSVQGEGKFVGVPSVFLRTFGCNFRCMNFGLKGEAMRDEKQKQGIIHNQEVQGLIDAGVHETTKEFNDLPIIHTGCDTYASIYPEFKKFNKQATVEEVVEHLLSLTPEGKWTMNNGQDVHLIMTGGEPLLAWQRLYVELFDHPRMQDLRKMLHLKQILHNTYMKISSTILTTKIELKSLGVVPQNLVLAENLGKLLLSLTLLVSISVLVIANFISSLLSLLMTTLTKLQKLWTLIEVPGWNVRYILCQWADAVKNMFSTSKKLPKHVWKGDGVLPPDFISPSLETPGELNKLTEYK